MPDIKQIPALINLLDEPDEMIFNRIREQLLAIGNPALVPLGTALENTFDPGLRERIQGIIRKINLETVCGELAEWRHKGSEDLLRGFILVTRTNNPDLKEEEVIVAVEQLRMDIWVELHENLTALENVKVINHVLFHIQHFEGNVQNLSEPQNSYINTVLETRKGNSLSLGMLYMILAQRLQLPIFGVNLPQHFILAYLTDYGIVNPTENDVLFYINPFTQGAVFTRREIELFIRQLKVKPDRTFFAPCTHIDIIRRLIHNLIFSYNQIGDPEISEDLKNLLKVLE
ncbi:MAG TPA: transglutaminase-like domain-containing protein [Bacteroidales bacterium]|nr:transglutaminase-like domain-containing protein [Bacteroidales bacterium]